MKKYLVSIFIAGLLVSCQPEPEITPIADFDLSTEGLISDVVITYSSNHEIKFFNKSEKAISYHWDFGNGDSSTEPNPNYTFQNPGLYRVSLTASSQTKTETTSSMDIQIIEERLELIQITKLNWYCIEDELDWADDTEVDIYFEMYTGGSSCCSDAIPRNVIYREKIGSNISRNDIPVRYYPMNKVIKPQDFSPDNVNFRVTFVKDSDECILADSRISMFGSSTTPTDYGYLKTVGGFLGANYEVLSKVYYE